MNDYNFKEEEIPFDTLGRFGLTKEMIADLPSSILEEITYGYRSPLLPVSMTDDEGRTIDSRTRFALVRMEDGSVDVVFFPKLEVNPLERFTEEQKAQLRMYKPIIGTMQTEDGESITAFHQLDHETDQILSVPSPVIGHNMQVLAETFRLSNAEINCLKNGEPLSVIEDDDMYTFGIDLERQTGILVVDGDTKHCVAVLVASVDFVTLHVRDVSGHVFCFCVLIGVLFLVHLSLFFPLLPCGYCSFHTF
jgi:hypothetical protein